jgi:hypothetical protein
MGWLLLVLGATIAVWSLVGHWLYPLPTFAVSTVVFVALVCIWLKFHKPNPGPRFEFQGIKTEHKDGYYVPSIQISNTSDVDATSNFVAGGIFISDFSNDSNNKDVSAAMNAAKDMAKKFILTPSDQLPITRGMGISLKTVPISDADVDSVNNGSKKMYVVWLAEYANSREPIKNVWVTALCAQVIKPFEGFQTCPFLNGYFYADRSLNRIN